MNVKTKAIGLFAGTALALSLATGVMAQDGTTVTLDGGGCTAILTGSSVDFGSYTWDGVDSYDSNEDAGNSTLTATVADTTLAGNGCDVTFSAGNMTDGSSTINVTYETDVLSASNPLTVEDVPTGSLTVDVAISSTLGASYEPGDYTGTVSIDAAAAS